MRSKTWPGPARKWDTFTLIHTNNQQQQLGAGQSVFSHSQTKTMSSSQLWSAGLSWGCCGDERRCGHGKNGPGSHCPGSIIILGRIVQEHCMCSILCTSLGLLYKGNHHQTGVFGCKGGKRIRRVYRLHCLYNFLPRVVAAHQLKPNLLTGHHSIRGPAVAAAQQAQIG